jgi:hypothetical protein
MVIDPFSDPPIVPMIYEWVVTAIPWDGPPEEHLVWSEDGETYTPEGQYPPWSETWEWGYPDSGGKTGADDDGMNVDTDPGKEQVFGLDDEHGDAPWREEHTMVVKFKWPGTTPVLPPAHLGFRWYGLYGYAEAYVKFGDRDYPMGVLAKGAVGNEDFTPVTVDPEVWHIFQMRIANGKVYARVFVEGSPSPPWMASVEYDATQAFDPARVELVVGSVAEEGVFDIEDPLADAIDIGWVGASLEPLPGQDIEDERIGNGDGISNEYEVSNPFVKGSLDVYIDGTYVTPTFIDEEAGTFILDAPPSPGATIVVDYTKA